MPEHQIQQEGMVLRSGYFNRDAFRRKSHEVLVLQTAVAGLWKHLDQGDEEDRKLLESLIPGTELKLIRDVNNDHDKWAVGVYTMNDRMIGYMTRYKNETISRLMDMGKEFHAYVDEMPEDVKNNERKIAPTEDYRLPFSVYMVED